MECVESVVYQYGVLEVILIEDGSSDNSKEIADRLVQRFPEKVKLYYHQNHKNLGASESRNLGIRKANAQFIAFLDADDVYLDNRFQNDIEVLELNEKVEGIYNAVGTILQDEYAVKRFKDAGYSPTHLTTFKSNVSSNKLFEKMGPIGREGSFHCNGLTVRKSVFSKTGHFHSQLELSQDTHMWLKMSMCSTLISGKLEEAVSLRRVHRNNRIADIEKLKKYRSLLFISLLDWAEEANVSYKRRNILCNRYLNWFLEDCLVGRNSFYKISKKVLKYKTFYKFFIKKFLPVLIRRKR